MDILHSIYSLILLILITLKDASSFTLDAGTSPTKAILGDNQFTLFCNYTISPTEMLFFIELQRRRESDGPDSNFATIVTFQSPFSPINVTYQDTDLESRTVATKPTVGSKSATLVFNRIECDDKAEYKWKAFYIYTDGTSRFDEKTITVTVKAISLFRKVGDPGYGVISFAPKTNLEEGDNVVFTCSGDVGNEPIGHLGWYYYLSNNMSSVVNASSKTVSTVPSYQSQSCSYTRRSTLQLTMVKEFNHIVVRCTVQQDRYNQFGNGFVQTNNIPVYYYPRITAIDDQVVDEGTESLTLTCKAAAYPAPFYSWLLPNGTLTDGPSLTLTGLHVGDNGTYTCVVYNTYKNQNHTVNETVYIDVRSSTSIISSASTASATPSTSSTSTASSTPVFGEPNHAATSGQKENVTNVICFSCDELSHLELCDVVNECDTNEVCYVERYEKYGRKLYRSGCLDTATCFKDVNTYQGRTDSCVECCSQNYCNSRGCGDNGLVERYHRGPLCYDCPHEWSTQNCNKLTLCEKNELCSIEEFRWGEHSHFKMSCAHGQCVTSSRSVHVATRALPVCRSCCSDDYCNLNCTENDVGSVIVG